MDIAGPCRPFRKREIPLLHRREADGPHHNPSVVNEVGIGTPPFVSLRTFILDERMIYPLRSAHPQRHVLDAADRDGCPPLRDE